MKDWSFSVLHFSVCLLAIGVGACGVPATTPEQAVFPTGTVVEDTVTQPTQISTTILTETPLPPILTPTETLVPTRTRTPSPTETSTSTNTPTHTPTYAILRGQVIPERANCRYGPGAMYLYKYGLVGGSNLEVIGRNERGTWVLIQAIGGSNPCWVKGDLMDIKGEVMSVTPVDPHIVQAWSPYYAPLTNVTAFRDGDKVVVSWSPLILRPGDDSEQVPYVVEAWVCQDGGVVFRPVGVYQTIVEIIDEPGCSEPSRGRVLAAEKHGYTWPVDILWP